MRDKPLYVISIVSEIIGIHPQTLRQYERLGLIEPSRTIGNTRLYSEEDLEQLKYITLLTKDHGVNLAGVEIILEMQNEIIKLHKDIASLHEYIKTKYGEDMIQKDESESVNKFTKINIIKE